MEIWNRWVNHNKCTDTGAQISLSFVWPRNGVGSWGVCCREWYMEPLWIFALRFVRDVMKLLSCDLVPEVSVIGISPEWVSHTLVFWFQGKNTLFQIAFFVNCSHAEEKNKSHTQTSRTLRRSRVLSSSLNNPHLHYTCVSYTCRHGSLWIINWTSEMLGTDARLSHFAAWHP